MANLTFENATLKIVYETGIDEYGDVVYLLDLTKMCARM